VAGADLRDAESVLLQLGEWIEDYHTRAPHSALGMRSPAECLGGDAVSSMTPVVSGLLRSRQ